MISNEIISDDDLNNKTTSINNNNNLIDKKLDYRVEWTSSASINFDKNISITGTYRYVHINAPKRKFIDSGNDNFQLFSAANRFTNFKISVIYAF